jgi:adenosylcobinamide kinase/adenosylcobinamide-phosphate guanylyltransferase
MSSPHQLILGGQRSGKSRHAERLGRSWLQASDQHSVVVLATATASDDEMRQRIERHKLDRPAGFSTVEEPIKLGAALRAASQPGRLVIVDCLTLWLANVLMPASADAQVASTLDWPALRADLLDALRELSNPVALVSNEIGLGVIPMGAEVRHFVDEMGRLNQDVAQCCGHITLMAAGQPFTKAVETWA